MTKPKEISPLFSPAKSIDQFQNLLNYIVGYKESYFLQNRALVYTKVGRVIGKDLKTVLRHVEKTTGVDASLYRYTTLMRRLGLRLSATRSKGYQDYLEELKKNPDESHKFIQTLTINVTDFFRDKEVFYNIQKSLFPGLLESANKRKTRDLRIWSVGCSRGQEPYSLAMLFLEAIRETKQEYKIRILATDVDTQALEKALSGCYSKKEVKNILLTQD